VMIFGRKRIKTPRRTAGQAGCDAVASLRNSFYCEHGEPRSSCTKEHVSGRGRQ
jgi:hypothetical protein